jgi:SAM-dependent methyltransferase
VNPLARGAAWVAFGPGALVYAALTGHRAWREDLRTLVALVPGRRVLDVGIGPGADALEVVSARPARHLLGLDRSGPMLRLAARRGRRTRVELPLVQGDALALPFRAGSLDGVTFHSVLYLLPDPLSALREARRVLRPGGAVALLEPRSGPASLPSALGAGPRCAASMLLWRYDERTMPALLDSAGFAGARAWPVLFGYGVMATAVAR